MNRLTFLVVVLFAMIMTTSFSGKSQTFQSTKDDVTIVLRNPRTGLTYSLTAGVEKILITPSGNFLRTVSFTIEPDAPIMNFSGPRRFIEVTMLYDIDGDGNDEVITDTLAVLTKSGKLTFVFHSNGAGSRLPRGWDF